MASSRDYGFGQDFAVPLPKPVPGGAPIQYQNYRQDLPWGSRDMWGNPIRATGGFEGVAAGVIGDSTTAPVWDGVSVLPGQEGYNPAAYTGASVGQYQPPAAPAAVPTTPAPATPETPAAFAGSGLNTLYGIDSESNLTEDQKKLARMIQGKYDASLNRRDRELAQYGAPRLASFTEDEALARAMSLARGLNIPVQDALGVVQGSGPASRGSTGGGGGGGSGSTGRAPSSSVTTPRTTTQANPIRTAAATAPPNSTPQQKQNWADMLKGMSAYIPLLFGKEGMDLFGNKGLWGMVQKGYNSIFGSDPPPFTYNVVNDLFTSTGNYTTVENITGGIGPSGNLLDPTGMGTFGIQGLTPAGVTPSFGAVDPYGPFGSYGGMAPPTTPFGYDNPLGGDYGSGSPYDGGGYDNPFGGDYGSGSPYDGGGFDNPFGGDYGSGMPYEPDYSSFDPSYWGGDFGYDWGTDAMFGADWGGDFVDPTWLESFWA